MEDELQPKIPQPTQSADAPTLAVSSGAAIDFQPLTTPVTRAEAEPYLKQIGTKVPSESVFIGALALLAILGMLFFGLLGGGGAGLVTGLVWIVVVVGILGSTYKLQYQQTQAAVRGIKFAAANGFSFVPSAVTNQPGTIWLRGYDHHDVQLITGMHQDRPFMLGTHMYTTGSGRDRVTHNVTFLRVTLPRELPHLLIDAHRDVLDLTEGINRSQRLSLEGDFDTYFTVYCPDGYQEDALYFLTPELMQLMIDNDRAYDMEVVGDQLYFYQNGRLRYDNATTRHLFGMLERTGGEFAQNTRFYKDDRPDAFAGAIAPEGMVLKRHAQVGHVAWTAIVLAYFCFQVYLAYHRR